MGGVSVGSAFGLLWPLLICIGLALRLLLQGISNLS